MPTPTFALDAGPPDATLRPGVRDDGNGETSGLFARLPRARFAPGRRLGEGGMGVVDAVRDPTLDRELAVKRPRNAAAAAALVTEARTLAALDHPRIVPVHGLVQDEDGTPLLLQKRVTGRPLSEVPLRDPEEEVRTALQLADALRLAHSRGILHRDLKPENVMLGELGELYLMDWGCACAPGTRLDEPVGTPAFMAPEQATPGAIVDARTDVYLLGAFLYARVTGRAPHGEDDVVAVMARAQRGDPLAWPPTTPPGLAAVVDKACARDPADRPADIAAFADTLRAWLGHRDAARLAGDAAQSAASMRACIAQDDPLADARFHEARFGYRAALEQWPACEKARVGLDALHEAWVTWKLTRGELATVEPVITTLPDAARWAPALAELRQAAAHAEAEWAASSPQFGARDRRDVFLAMTAAVLVVLAALAPSGAPASTSPTALLTTGVVGVLIPVVVIAVFRRRILGHRLNAGLATAVLVVAAITLYHRVLALQAGTDGPTILRADTEIALAALGMLGVAMHPRFAWIGLPYVGALIGIVVAPAHAAEAYGAAATASIGVALALLWPRGRA